MPRWSGEDHSRWGLGCPLQRSPLLRSCCYFPAKNRLRSYLCVASPKWEKETLTTNSVVRTYTWHSAKDRWLSQWYCTNINLGLIMSYGHIRCYHSRKMNRNSWCYVCDCFESQIISNSYMCTHGQVYNTHTHIHSADKATYHQQAIGFLFHCYTLIYSSKLVNENYVSQATEEKTSRPKT